MSGQKGKIKSMMCNPVFYVIMTFCMILPQFILNLDWGRWCRAICIGQTATSLAAVGMGKTWAVAGLEKIRNFMDSHRILLILMIGYIAALGAFSGADYIDEVETATAYVKEFFMSGAAQ
jgi:hypothetical protein